MHTFRLAGVIGVLAIAAWAGVPQQMNYQGRLVSGTNLVNGQVSLVLEIYSAAEGGARLYADSNTVTVVDGLYSTLIGDNTVAGTLTGALDSAQAWLQVKVNGTTLAPRARLASAAYALNAASAADLSSTLSDARLSSNVALLNAAQSFSRTNIFAGLGIGATNPQNRLEVRVQRAADGIRVDSSGSGAGPAISLSTNNVLRGELGLSASNGQFSGDSASGDFVMRNSAGKVLIQSGSGSSAICIATNNYVGIRKASPATALDVNGTVTASNFAGDGSALINLDLNKARGDLLTVGQDWGDGPFQVYGSTWIKDQENPFFGWYLSSWGAWQSFTAGTNGTLDAIQFWIYSYTGGNWEASFSIYNGQGTTGTVLSSQSIAGDGIVRERTFKLETPIQVTEGSQYTIYFHGSSAEMTIRASTDTYPGGRSSYSTNYDYHFATYIFESSSIPVIVVQPHTLNVGIGTSNPTNKLHVIGTVQATAYITGSDRSTKENIAPAVPDEILDRVSALPIMTWNFKDDASGPHLGPMAQDFHAIFGLGNTDSGIFTVDADGVALAAIQGLNRKLEAELRAKESEIEALEYRLEQLERMLEEDRRAQNR